MSNPKERPSRGTLTQAAAADFVGTWRLIDYSFVHDDGIVEKPWGTDVRGYLLYSAEGYMSGNLGPAGAAAESSSASRLLRTRAATADTSPTPAASPSRETP